MALSHNPRIVTNGLVLALDAANPKSYPGTGTTWFDLSGNGNHAVLSGSPTISNGVVSFDGTDDFATISTNGTGSLDFGEEQTVMMWLKHSFTSGRRNPWDQAYGGYGTWTHEQGGYINYYWGDNGGNARNYDSLSSASTIRNKWNCLTVSRNTATIKWYTDSIETASTSNPYGVIPLTTNNIRIGRGYAGYWIGEMGVIMAYNRALSNHEISQIYISYRRRFSI